MKKIFSPDIARAMKESVDKKSRPKLPTNVSNLNVSRNHMLPLNSGQTLPPYISFLVGSERGAIDLGPWKSNRGPPATRWNRSIDAFELILSSSNEREYCDVCRSADNVRTHFRSIDTSIHTCKYASFLHYLEHNSGDKHTYLSRRRPCFGTSRLVRVTATNASQCLQFLLRRVVVADLKQPQTKDTFWRFPVRTFY